MQAVVKLDKKVTLSQLFEKAIVTKHTSENIRQHLNTQVQRRTESHTVKNKPWSMLHWQQYSGKPIVYPSARV